MEENLLATAAPPLVTLGELTALPRPLVCGWLPFPKNPALALDPLGLEL